jgi:glycerol uptake facilitator-like aquaporin
VSASLGRRILAEFLGTALLLAAVVGSGIMAERSCGGNAGLALLANTLATGAMLLALILGLGAVSGAHFNPLVTLGEAWARALPRRDVLSYLAAQVGGAFLGVAVAHLMFGEALFTPSTHTRSGGAQAFSEFVATFGLVVVLRCAAHSRPESVAPAVAAYIASAYWFTASTSFANPAVTLARACTDSFAGIRPGDAPAFVLSQLIGAVAATGTLAWLHPDGSRRREQRESRS